MPPWKSCQTRSADEPVTIEVLCYNSAKHPSVPPSCNWHIVFSVKTGRCSCNMDNASAHDAQWAGFATLRAERNPNPPRRIGKNAVIRTMYVESNSPGMCSNFSMV